MIAQDTKETMRNHDFDVFLKKSPVFVGGNERCRHTSTKVSRTSRPDQKVSTLIMDGPLGSTVDRYPKNLFSKLSGL